MTVFAWTKRLAMIVPALAVTLAMQGAAHADEHLEDVVKARQGYFKLVLHNAGPLFGMAKGDVGYDAAAASMYAGNLLLLSKMDIGTLFPAGTSKDEMPGKTRALMKIWEDPDGVDEKAEAWREAVAGMDMAAGNGLDALRGAIGDLGNGCKGCHDNYRAKDF